MHSEALMGRIGMPELVIILVIVLLIFGPKKIPDLARSVGQAIRGFKQGTKETEHEDSEKPSAPTNHKA
jgi:sec-independent protein translocase protein TatA